VAAEVTAERESAEEKRRQWTRRKTSQGGGGQTQRDVQPTELELQHPLTLLEPSMLVGGQRGFIPYRTNAVVNQYSDGRMCCMDACHAAAGEVFLRAVNVKIARTRRVLDPTLDCAVADVMDAIKAEGHPLRFEGRPTLRWPQLTCELKGGLFVCRLNFIDGDTGKVDKHFVAVDCWRQIIMDNAETRPVPFASRSGKQLMQRIECAALEKVWQLMVQATRRGETQFV
jgi:hypothetical protein